MTSKKKKSGRPGKNKTPMEIKLRHYAGLLEKDIERFKVITEKLTKAKTALESEVSEVLDEIVQLGETQQEQINTIFERLDRLEGKQREDGNEEQTGDKSGEETGEETGEEAQQENTESHTKER